LLADDRRDVWRVVKYFLDRQGAQVTVAEDGRQAVDEANRARHSGQPFDLILMDMQMPVMNGREAVTTLREQGFEVPIVALTADAMSGERETCISFGCTEYFPKPVDGPALVQLIAGLLEA
jgi:CheY-like chemotaxis protein